MEQNLLELDLGHLVNHQHLPFQSQEDYLGNHNPLPREEVYLDQVNRHKEVYLVLPHLNLQEVFLDKHKFKLNHNFRLFQFSNTLLI